MSIQYVSKIKELKHLSKMQTKEDIKNFELLAWELAQTKDLFILKELLSLFDDNCEFSEVMWGLLHIVETYNNEDYVGTVLTNLNIMFPKAKEWITTILYRILNDTKYFNILLNNLYLGDKKILNEIFNIMYEESEIHREKIELLRGKL